MDSLQLAVTIFHVRIKPLRLSVLRDPGGKNRGSVFHLPSPLFAPKVRISARSCVYQLRSIHPRSAGPRAVIYALCWKISS